MTDLLLTNANVVTMDPDYPEAGAVAIKDGRILHVGKENDLKGFVKSGTGVIDLGGKTVLPGFIDAHLHLRALGESLVTLNIGPKSSVSSISDIQKKIHRQTLSLPRGTWIRAGGYNEIYLAEKRDPNRRDLDAAAPFHPVKLTHRSGHVHVLNSLALNRIGISRETPDPREGIVDRDLETGEQTGIFYGLADFLSTLIPPMDDLHLIQGIKLAEQQLFSSGITSIHDASNRNDLQRFRFFERLYTDERLKCRVLMMLGPNGFEEYKKNRFTSQIDENRFHAGGVKIVIDETTGRLNPDQDSLNRLVLSIHLAGMQAAIHAIEETAVEAACIALENALRISPGADHRHRIEHCSVCPPETAGRISSLGAMVVTNPAFLYFSGERYLKTVPPGQLKYLYPMSTFITNGIHTAAGSDAPIAAVNPLIGIYAAAARRAENGMALPDKEKITPYEALQMYTGFAAMSSFEENLKGTITPGKLADLAVLTADPTAGDIQIDEIREIRVEMTILGGEVVYSR